VQLAFLHSAVEHRPRDNAHANAYWKVQGCSRMAQVQIKSTQS